MRRTLERLRIWLYVRRNRGHLIFMAEDIARSTRKHRRPR